MKTKIFSTHQRLNVKHSINKFFTTSVCHISNIPFCNWLAGVTDGDGSFSFSVNKKKNRIWNCTFKIGQNIYNLKMYNYIKQEYGFGSTNLKSGKNHTEFRIRDRKTLINQIVPLFSKYALYTTKQFYFLRWATNLRFVGRYMF